MELGPFVNREGRGVLVPLCLFFFSMPGHYKLQPRLYLEALRQIAGDLCDLMKDFI